MPVPADNRYAGSRQVASSTACFHQPRRHQLRRGFLCCPALLPPAGLARLVASPGFSVSRERELRDEDELRAQLERERERLQIAVGVMRAEPEESEEWSRAVVTAEAGGTIIATLLWALGDVETHDALA